MSSIFILAVMAIGVLIGARWFPEKYQKYNALFQTVCTAVLIFAMGVSLGNRPRFFTELRELGLDSLIYAVIPILFSTVLVYILTKAFMEKKKEQDSVQGGKEE